MEGSLNYRKTTGFLFLLMTLLFSGIIFGRAQESPLDVNGIVGGSVLLPLKIPQGLSILEVRWKLFNKVRLGDSKGQKFEAFHLASPTITQRLEMENAATLRITTVTKNDSGIYRAEVQYENGLNEEKEFRLNVYDSPLEMRMLGYFIILVALIVLSILVVFIFLKMKTKKKKKKKEGMKAASTYVELLKTSLGETLYTEINTTSPGVIEQDRYHLEDYPMNLQKGKLTETTVYQNIQSHPKRTSTEASKREVY
ncbi:SLAM family member 6-like isoform X3 [Pleurodeles waltl]|uniref:SLAM family member 6-like isoform X3 n=1 Tax=Pleurodeles waltl TaxID=8319 RepID=UPI0037096C04